MSSQPRDLGSEVPQILCQPGGRISCGACCGVYNDPNAGDAEFLRGMLVERTRAYRETCEITDPDTLKAFRRAWEPTGDDKLLSELPSCPFLGLIDDEPDGRVGCLVHPLQNDGVDGRDCGVYDRFICEEYLCAAHTVMKTDEKWLVIQAVEDAYLYGLVITDVRFVRQLFERTAAINGMMPPTRALVREDAIEAAAAYFELKRTWRWRDEDGVFGQVVPGEGLETSRRPDPAESLNAAPGPYDAILRCLGTRVDDLDALDAARTAVQARVAAFAASVDI